MTKAVHLSSSPLATYADSLIRRIKRVPSQMIVAGVALAIGACCVWDGPGFWRILFTLVASLAASGIVLFEASQAGLLKTHAVEWAVALEAFAAMVLTISIGFEGAQVLFGIALGSFSAVVVGDWAQRVGTEIPGLEIVWYSVGAVLGLVLMTGWRQVVLATVAPLLGGLLIASGLGVVVSRPIGSYPLNMTQVTVGYWVPPNDVLWPDALLELLHGTDGSLVAHLICALVSALAYMLLHSRLIATSILAVSIIASGCVAALGLGCEPDKQRCPEWMLPARPWQWPVLGSSIWLLVTTVSAHEQLRRVQDWSRYGMSRYISDRNRSFKTRRSFDEAEPIQLNLQGNNPHVNYMGQPMYNPAE